MLSDFIRFNILDRTKHDATVAACLAVYGAQKYKLKNMKRNNVTQFDAGAYYNFAQPQTKNNFVRI
jgi:hypothetical protein